MSQPPPLPDRSAPAAEPPLGSALQYQSPLPHPSAGPGTPKVFDTVAGPNLRVRDNLIQLACVIVGSVAGALIGRSMSSSSGLLIGLLAGLVGFLLLSGLVIGIIRLTGARKK